VYYLIMQQKWNELVVRGQQAIQHLISALQENEDTYLPRKENIIKTLGEIADPQAVYPLIDVLKCNDLGYCRAHAVEALGKIRDVRAVEPLIEIFKNIDKNVEIAAKTMISVPKENKVQLHTAAAFLVKNLVGADDIKTAIIWTLGEIGDDSATELLKSVLQRKDPITEAMQTLSQKLKNRTSEYFATESVETEKNLKKKAEEALMKIGLEKEKRNLIRWQKSDQPRLWVEVHRGQWDHEEWLSLLETLRKSEFWPMSPDAVGRALDELKKEWHARERMRPQPVQTSVPMVTLSPPRAAVPPRRESAAQ